MAPRDAAALEGSTDLTRSAILLANDGGRQLTDFLKTGRPERRMPPFSLADAEVADLSAFFRSVAPAPGRGGGGGRGVITAVVVGDATAGEALLQRRRRLHGVPLADGRSQRHRHRG